MYEYDDLDNMIRSRISSEDCTFPEDFDEQVNQRLADLPKKPSGKALFLKKSAAVAAVAAFFLLASAFTMAVGLNPALSNFFRAEAGEQSLLTAATRDINQSHTFDDGWTVKISQAISDSSNIVALIEFIAPEEMDISDHDWAWKVAPLLEFSIYSPDGAWIDGNNVSSFQYLEDSAPEDGHIYLLWMYSTSLPVYYLGDTEIKSLLGAEITLSPLGWKDTATDEAVVFSGDKWDCTFTLPETDSALTYDIGQPLKIGNTEAELISVRLSPICFSFEFGTYAGSGHYGSVFYASKASSLYCFTLADGGIIPARDHFSHSSVAAGDTKLVDSSGQRLKGKNRIELIPAEFVDPQDIVSVTILGQTFDLKE